MSLSTVTRASLGARALDRANLKYSTFIEPAELNQLVDTSMAQLYNILVGLYQDYFVKTRDYTLDGSESYALPADFFKTRMVVVRDTSGTRYELDWLEMAETANMWDRDLYNGVPTGYNILDGQLKVYPQGSVLAGTLRMFYIPEYTPPVSDDEQIKFAIAFGWDEWVVNNLAIQIRNKAMMPAEELVRERGMIEQRMVHEANNRQGGRPRRVSDTGFGRGSYWRGRGDFSRR